MARTPMPFLRGVLFVLGAVGLTGALYLVTLARTGDLQHPQAELAPILTVEPRSAEATLIQSIQVELEVAAPTTVTQLDWVGRVTSIGLEVGSSIEEGMDVGSVDGTGRVLCIGVPQHRAIGLGDAGPDVDALRRCLAARDALADVEPAGAPAGPDLIEAIGELGTSLGLPGAASSDPSWFAFSRDAGWQVVAVDMQLGAPPGPTVALGAPEVKAVSLLGDSDARATSLLSLAQQLGLTPTVTVGRGVHAVDSVDALRAALHLSSVAVDTSTSSGTVTVEERLTVGEIPRDVSTVPLAALPADASCVIAVESGIGTPFPIELLGQLGQSAFVRGDLAGRSILLDPAGFGAVSCAPEGRLELA